MAMLTVAEAAERLEVNTSRVRQLILARRLKATKFGRDWQIDEADLAAVEVRTAGWPKGKPRKPPKPVRKRRKK